MKTEHDEKTTNKRAKQKEWEARNPEKVKARIMVGVAIKRGDLTRLPCEVCGSFPTDGHHDDYSKPLSVRWLCRNHHIEHHVKARAEIGVYKEYRPTFTFRLGHEAAEKLSAIKDRTGQNSGKLIEDLIMSAPRRQES